MRIHGLRGGPGGGRRGIVASDAGVFWVDQGNQVDSSTIQGCPLAGCDGGPTPLATGQNTLLALAADDTTIFWGSGDGQGTLGISSCPATGCATPTTVASQPLSALSIAVDPANVYWTDGDTLWACPRAGCTGSPTVLTTNLQRAASLTVSDGAVYWANTNGNTIASCSARLRLGSDDGRNGLRAARRGRRRRLDPLSMRPCVRPTPRCTRAPLEAAGRTSPLCMGQGS